MTNALKIQWIIALNQTIVRYSKQIMLDQPHNTDGRCPLCILSRQLNNARIDCNQCIHTNLEFGQGIKCVAQLSFTPLGTPKTWMTYRRSYLIKIRGKLIKSL